MSDKAPHVVRMIDEKQALGQKLEDLFKFINDSDSIFNQLASEEKADLLAQYDAMSKYYVVLVRRIGRAEGQ